TVSPSTAPRPSRCGPLQTFYTARNWMWSASSCTSSNTSTCSRANWNALPTPDGPRDGSVPCAVFFRQQHVVEVAAVDDDVGKVRIGVPDLGLDARAAAGVEPLGQRAEVEPLPGKDIHLGNLKQPPVVVGADEVQAGEPLADIREV